AESSRSCTVFPLYLTNESNSPQGQFVLHSRRPNLNPLILRSLASTLGLEQTGEFGLPHGISPEDILNYAYGVLHSPGYRKRYAPFLRIDFPRIAFTPNRQLFRDMAALGGELVAMHLMQSERFSNIESIYFGPSTPTVERISFSDGTVWLDRNQTSGFR